MTAVFWIKVALVLVLVRDELMERKRRVVRTTRDKRRNTR